MHWYDVLLVQSTQHSCETLAIKSKNQPEHISNHPKVTGVEDPEVVST
jgi:hypothetical protein